MIDIQQDIKTLRAVAVKWLGDGINGSFKADSIITHIDALTRERDELREALHGLLTAVQRSVCEGSGPAQDKASDALRSWSQP